VSLRAPPLGGAGRNKTGSKESRNRRAEVREQKSESRLSRYLVVAVLLIVLFVSAVSVRKFLEVMPAGLGRPAISVSAGGQTRDVDLQRIRTMIRQKKLSDREAEFYKKVE